MRSLLSSILIAAFLLTIAAIPALARPSGTGAIQPTAYQTATPLADGRILYTVQDGDTLWKISAITGVPIDELERLNNISRDDPLQVGKVLILRIVTPTYAEPTLAFLPSATPSPLPVTGKGTICVSFFNDINGDGSQKADTEELVRRRAGQRRARRRDRSGQPHHRRRDRRNIALSIFRPANTALRRPRRRITIRPVI